MAEAASKPQVIIKVKRRGGGGGHHGGAWKVAYADFVTAMMALFIVLWLLTQADLQLRQQIARYFRNASVLSGGSMVGESVQPAKSSGSHPLEAALSMVQGTGEDLDALRGHAAQIQEMLRTAPDLGEIKEQVQVGVTGEGLEIQIVDSGEPGRKDLLFDIASSDLKPELVKLLRRIAVMLGKLPNHISIGGHTDARPFSPGSRLSNWDLAFARANAARIVMEASGLKPDQIQSIEAYASRKLLKPNDPFAAENRRLSVLALRQPGSGKKKNDEIGDVGAEADDALEQGRPGTAADDAASGPTEGVFPSFTIPGLPPR